jgi:hypothetical protein
MCHVILPQFQEMINEYSNNELTRFNKSVFIIMNLNLMDVYMNKNMVPI